VHGVFLRGGLFGFECGFACWGETVFLQSAVWFFREGAFDEAGGEGGVEVVGPESGAVGKLELRHALEGAEWAVFQGAEELSDLIADLIADLIGFGGLVERCEQGAEEKFYESGGVARLIACAQHLVVFCLSFTDHGFHWQEGEEGVPVTEDEGLPQATDATIAIGEGVDEFEFVVKDATCDERVGVGVLQPGEQVFHEAVDLVGGGREMHKFLPLCNANRAGSESACVIDERRHEQAMGGEQILEIVGVPSVHGLVGGEGIFDFLNIGGRAEHAFALDDCRDLFKAEGVVFDGE